MTNRKPLSPHPWPAKLREARGKRSLREVAAVAGVCPGTVHRLELGKGRIRSFLQVVAALGVHPAAVTTRRVS